MGKTSDTILIYIADSDHSTDVNDLFDKLKSATLITIETYQISHSLYQKETTMRLINQDQCPQMSLAQTPHQSKAKWKEKWPLVEYQRWSRWKQADHHHNLVSRKLSDTIPH